MTDETLPEPDGCVFVITGGVIAGVAVRDNTVIGSGSPTMHWSNLDGKKTVVWTKGEPPQGEFVYTASTLREAVKRANYALLMRLHEENKHKHNFFHCAAVKLMEESK